jgi:hypothetical protein
MMIIRTSASLNKRIHVYPEEALPLCPNPYTDWTARLFTADCGEYIIVTNTTSLYSALMSGAGVTDEDTFIQRSIVAIRDQLDEDGKAFLFERLVAPETGRIAFSKTLNASVTKSMNAIVRRATFYIEERGHSAFAAARLLGGYPMVELEHASPREAFVKMPIDGNA